MTHEALAEFISGALIAAVTALLVLICVRVAQAIRGRLRRARIHDDSGWVSVDALLAPPDPAGSVAPTTVESAGSREQETR